MKELSVEEKAKRYDSMFERLREMYNNNKTNVADRLIYERYFPELKESEDERIRKALIEAIRHNYVLTGSINHIPTKDILAWLEKQGEHAKFRDSIQVGDKVTRNQDGVLVNLSQLKRVAKPAEEQGEQKQELLTKEKALKNSPFVEQKHAEWSEEDEKEVAVLKAYIRSKDWSGRHIDRALGIVDELVNKVKSLRPQPKQEWSEEDKQTFIKSVEALEDFGKFELADWLKEHKNQFLKPQNTWKPSDEQMNALNYVVNLMASSERPTENDLYYNILKSLRQQLKKLMEDKLKDK